MGTSIRSFGRIHVSSCAWTMCESAVTTCLHGSLTHTV